MDTTVNNYPERFLTYLEVEKNCSQHTIESYQKDLAAFAEFMLRRNKQNFFWQQTGPLDVRGYLAELNEKQYARRTIARRISALRSFFKYLVREAVIEYSPLTKVRTPKLEKKLPAFLRCPIKVRYWGFVIRRCWRCFMLPAAVYPSW